MIGHVRALGTLKIGINIYWPPVAVRSVRNSFLSHDKFPMHLHRQSISFSTIFGHCFVSFLLTKELTFQLPPSTDLCLTIALHVENLKTI